MRRKSIAGVAARRFTTCRRRWLLAIVCGRDWQTTAALRGLAEQFSEIVTQEFGSR